MEPMPHPARVAARALAEINAWLLMRSRCAWERRADPGTAGIIRARLALIVACGYAVTEPLCAPLALVPRAEVRHDAPRWLAAMEERTPPPPRPDLPTLPAPPRQLRMEGL